MVSLESCNGLSRHWSKNTIDRSGIITVPLQLGLDFNHDLVGRQIAVTDPVDRRGAELHAEANIVSAARMRRRLSSLRLGMAPRAPPRLRVASRTL